jgi:hypothetical protein
MIELWYIDGPRQIPLTLYWGVPHAVAWDEPSGPRRRCLVLCSDPQIAKDILKNYTGTFEISTDRSTGLRKIVFGIGVTISNLLPLFCHQNGINPTDQRGEGATTRSSTGSGIFVTRV